MLTIKIDRATQLRRADAKKMKDCDPKVYIWVPCLLSKASF